MVTEMITLYLVVPAYNEEEILPWASEQLKNKIRSLRDSGRISSASRIVLVNDGSTDRTPQIMHGLHLADQVFDCIHFSRNFGHQSAVLAGYLHSMDRCDAVISIDADLQQDINAIDRFLDEFEAGHDIVYGVRNSRDTDTGFKRVTSQLFYRLMHFLGAETIPNHADYRLLSNKVLHALSEYRESNIYLRGLIPSLGFASSIVYFDVSERRAGKSKYTLAKMLKLASDGITSFSIKPMHLVFCVGVAVFFIAILEMVIVFIEWLTGRAVSGYPTITMSIWALGGLQLSAIGLIGEYVGHGYMESKHRPRYIIESVECTPEEQQQ